VALGGLLLYAVGVVLVALILPGILQRLLEAEDVFVLVSLAIAISLSGLGALVFHVPVALAAFVGGLAITEGRETLRLRRELIPFRVVFSVFFFVSIGFVFDPAQLGPALPLLGVLIALVVLAKAAVVAGIARATRLSGHPVLVGTALGQMGEFGFVIASTLLVQGAIGPSTFAAVIACVAISVAASTILYRTFRRRVPGHAGEGAGHADHPSSHRHAETAVDTPAPGAA